MAQPSTLVGELALHLRLPADLQSELDAVRSRTSGPWIQALLTELDERLHAALGAVAVIRIRHLALKCSVPIDGLDSPLVAIQIANDTAEQLLAELRTQSSSARLRPSSDEIVCFEDTAHRDAACWADRLDGRVRWFHDSQQHSSEAVGRVVLETGSAHLARVLGWLLRMHCAERACTTLSTEQLVTALEGVPASAVEERRVLTQALHQRGLEGALERVRRARPADAPSAEHGKRPEATGATEHDVAATTSASATRQSQGDASFGPETALARTPSTAAPAMPAGSHASAVASELDAAKVETRAPISGAPDKRGVAALPPVHLSADTKYGGLFYLVNTTLQLDLAETLWAAGISEAAFLAHIALAICRDETDVAWRWFGAGFDDKPLPLPEVPTWAVSELHDGVLHGLGRRLARIGVTTTPEALSDTLSRLRAYVPRTVGANEETSQLVAHCAAALACAVAAELRVPMSWDPVLNLVQRDAVLVCTSNVLWVGLPASAVDVELRRAGLDQDCSWAPWLTRAVRFEFRGLEEL